MDFHSSQFLSGLKVRHLQAFMLFFCLCSNYLMRVNLSIALVLMTDLNSTSSARVFDWTVTEQSAPQSIFFAGYFFMNLAAAVLVTKLNNKYLLLGSVSVSSATTLVLPALVTAGGYYILLAMRFTLGIMQGCMMACIMGLMSRWVPDTERSRCGALVLGGIHMGNLISFSVSGWIGSHYGGWPSIFYFSGTFGAVWSILWVFIGAESADTCSYISTEEKQFIEKHLAATATLPKSVPVPWRQIIRSKACWAILLATLGHGWGYWTLVSEIPTYFNSVLHLSPTLNGIVTALPFACMWIISFPSSYVSDFLVKKKIVSVTACRKIFNSIGHIGAAVCLVLLGLTRHKDVLIMMYITGVTLLSFAYIGHNINHLDILPNFAGFLMGLTNGLSNIASIAGPLFAGAVIHDASNPNEWRIVFFVSAAIFFIGALAFIFMATSEELEFNKTPEEWNDKTRSPSVSSVTCYEKRNEKGINDLL